MEVSFGESSNFLQLRTRVRPPEKVGEGETAFANRNYCGEGFRGILDLNLRKVNRRQELLRNPNRRNGLEMRKAKRKKEGSPRNYREGLPLVGRGRGLC